MGFYAIHLFKVLFLYHKSILHIISEDDLALTFGLITWSTSFASVIPLSLVTLHITSASVHSFLDGGSPATMQTKALSSVKFQGTYSGIADTVSAGVLWRLIGL